MSGWGKERKGVVSGTDGREGSHPPGVLIKNGKRTRERRIG